jgi:hypothetical protein
MLELKARYLNLLEEKEAQASELAAVSTAAGIAQESEANNRALMVRPTNTSGTW